MIDLGIDRQLLYSARNIEVRIFRHDGGNLETAPATGFILKHEDSAYLVTNRHVVDPPYRGTRYSGAKLESLSFRGFDICPDHHEHQATWCIENPQPIYPDNLDDVAVLSITDAVVCDGQPCRINNYFPSTALATEEDFSAQSDRSNSILPGDVLAICGFPGFDQSPMERPVALVGFLSSDPQHCPNPIPLNEEGVQIQSDRVCLYQGFSRGGASGSPIVAVQRGMAFNGAIRGPAHRPIKIIGINAGRIKGRPEEPSAVSYLIRSDSILEALANAVSI